MHSRPETRGDAAAIRDLTHRAFEGHPHSDGSEPVIIDRLRQAEALTLSLVAIDGGVIVGHVAFSAVDWPGEGRWAGLGPVSVHPQRQRQGIGTALIREGLLRIEALAFDGCVVLGDPGYYGRFGFEVDPNMTYPDVPPEFFMRRAFGPVRGRGEVCYHPAFG